MRLLVPGAHEFLQLLRARAISLCYFYVYGYRHPTTKVWRYIGKGCTNGKHDRKNKHLVYARHQDWSAEKYPNPHVINWIRKLLNEGLAPEIVLIKVGMSSEHAYAYEAELVARIGRVEDGGTLYNLDSGGLGGIRKSEETRRKMSIARIGKPSGMLGKMMSEETRRKQSESHKGQPAWNKGQKPSEESNRSRSISQLGRKDTEETRRKKKESAVRRWTLVKASA